MVFSTLLPLPRSVSGIASEEILRGRREAGNHEDRAGLYQLGDRKKKKLQVEQTGTTTGVAGSLPVTWSSRASRGHTRSRKQERGCTDLQHERSTEVGHVVWGSRGSV
ncbi:hypothetical protein NDU88_005213 [Pleurodeles waltl]|uniref:Uncharacterized protein n=1 Tax=Pleurodeles waltl TaxID=8319 RepID=A0AAV7MZH6_PLEWA|nr:hypothetical protein NDU88_005213 [Pleurodeles waltl]